MAEEKLPDLDDLRREREEQDAEAERAENIVNAASKHSSETRGDLYSLLEKFRSISFREHLDVAMPCKVVEYSRSARMAVVKPLVREIPRDTNGGTTGSKQIAREEIFCTVQQYAANGFVIDLPIKPGDVGWCIAADRDATAAKLDHNIHDAVSTLSHRFEFGFFIPDYWGNLGKAEKVVPHAYDGAEEGLVISTINGNQRILIEQEDIVIDSKSAKGDIRIVLADGEITITAAKQCYVNAPSIDFVGDLTVSGTITAGGEITANNNSTKNTVGKHTHLLNISNNTTLAPTAQT